MGLGPNFRWRSGLPVNDERASIGFLEYRIDAAADGRFRYRGVDIDFQRYWLALRPGGVCKNLLQGREGRSEEHTSELQSRGHLVCRLPLEQINCRQLLWQCAAHTV